VKDEGRKKAPKNCFSGGEIIIFKLQNSGCYRSERLTGDDLEIELSSLFASF
jgi:hypothetical protein